MAKLLRLLLAGVITAAAAFQAVRLVAPADGAPAVRRQMAFLRDELESGAAEQAQRQFPEGYLFLYALYGLTAVHLGLDSPPSSRADELADARWALAALETDAGRAPFAGDMQPELGVFYRGWTNWLRGGILHLQPPATRDAAEAERFEADSAELAAAFDESAVPFLQSYPGRAWPVDSTVAMASLSLHDKLFPPRYDTTIIRWVAGVRANLDPATGLVPHTADPDTGAPTAGARGTSQSLINRFLPEIDTEFASGQYVRFRELFLNSPLGLGPAVREYPHGTDGPADVDSGPLPLGISLSATVVTLGAARVHGDASLAGGLGNFGDAAGLPLDTLSTRRYAFGARPIGDAFLAWAKSDRQWVGESPKPPSAISWWWRLPLLLVFLIVGAAPWLLSAIRRRRVRSVSS